MASYVQITFDRTNPKIDIYAPRYTTDEVVNIVTVEADEPLSTYQEFYIEDNKGVIHNYTFVQIEPHIYMGRIKLSNMPYGILKLYARVRDEVDNQSNLEMATIELKESLHFLTMAEAHRSSPIMASERIRDILDNDRESLIGTGKKLQPIKISETTRTIKTKESRVDIDS